MRPEGERVRFHTHDEAWRYFLERREPLPSLRDRLPEDPATTLIVWLIPLAERLRPAVVDVQERLRGIASLRCVPGHFLHVTVAGSEHARVDAGPGLAGLEPFPIRLPRVGGLLEAVIAEVEGEGVREAARRLGTPADTFLPHVSLAYTWASVPVEPVRAAVRPLRDHELGEQLVEEVHLCEVPASPATFLQPWRVLERVRLGR